MKVLMIHVGNEVKLEDSVSNEFYLKRKMLTEDRLGVFEKFDIINADSQMQSIMDEGVGVDYGHFSERKSLSALLRAGNAIRRRSKNVDVVHVLWGTTTALITVMFSRKPVVISFCGSDLLGNVDINGSRTISGKISRFISQFSGLFAKSIITKSEIMKNSLWKRSRSKCTPLPNGVELRNFYPIDRNEARDHLKWDKKNKIAIFFSGNDAPVKDEPLARQIMEMAKEHYPNCEMKVVTGVAHDELKYYYNSADVMLLTSHHEGSNNSLKEAMACNTPIVSVKVGDSKERLEGINNCFVCDTRDPAVLAEKVKAIFDSNNRSNGQDSIATVSMQYIAKQVIKVYERTVVN